MKVTKTQIETLDFGYSLGIENVSMTLRQASVRAPLHTFTGAQGPS